ncbi:MAG: hypothetical protein EOO88_47925 [Pedobacter sp.]|nr:MAG: hypothetical protein EOO88_47925 [Pedobacter sp.]
MNNQVLGTWDFVTGNASVTEDDAHGMMCFSTIAANIPGQFVGKAPKANFYLFRTEDVSSEYPIEEFNWATGAERADSTGADIISSSLGYGYEFNPPVADYPFSDLNGDITMSARAADIAAAKGLLVFNSAGNSGNDYWKRIITPGDADSIITVGAVSTTGVVGSFSSYGPAADGRIKPDVASVGVAAIVQGAGNTIATSNGTSFACPNMAGLGTCLWQGFPEVNNMRIVRALREAGSIASTPNDRIGYGIPDMKKAFVILLKRFYSQQIQQAGCNTSIKWTSKIGSNMSFQVQRKLPTDADYVNIQTINGTGNFALKNFAYTDDLSSFSTPINIAYRIRMNLDTDSSFFFPPVTISHLNSCNTYRFTGNGNWTTAANWAGNLIPPSPLPAGSSIIIDPVITGECILNIVQQVQAGGYFEVRSGKKLTVIGDLIIQ